MSDEVFRLARFNGVDEYGSVLLDTEEEGLSVVDLVIGKSPKSGDVVILVQQDNNIFACGVTAIEIA